MLAALALPGDSYFGATVNLAQNKALGFNGTSKNITETYGNNLLTLNMVGSNLSIDLGAAIHANNTTGAQGTNTLAATQVSSLVDTGTMQFGTYATSTSVTPTGYISIVDAGGTTRHLAVIPKEPT